MRFALFLGCNIPARLQDYDLSSRAVLGRLGVDLTDIREFNCCGYPIRNFDFKAFLLSSARNIALANRHHLDMLVLCKCCYGSLKKADDVLRNDMSLREEINRILSEEGLKFEGNSEIKHLLSVMYHDIGIKKIKENITRPYSDLKIAVHYGCHALRPSPIVQFDDPVAPSLFDSLVEVTGAESIFWSTKLECCGAPLLGINDELSRDLTIRKLSDGRKSGADYLCTACPYCQMQFETVQKSKDVQDVGILTPSPVLFPQLLGLAMGISNGRLGIQTDQHGSNAIEAFLT